MRYQDKKRVFLCTLFPMLLLLFGARTMPQENHETMLFVGDIMLDRGVREQVERYGERDYLFPFQEIKKELEQADILFGNLESVISKRGERMGSIYSFRADPLAAKGLSEAGFDILSLANNHTFDYGRTALKDTMRLLSDAGVKYTGTGFDKEEARTPVVLETREATVGFLAYTEFLFPYAQATRDRSGVAPYDKKSIRKDIERAKEKADIIVVSFHYGVEYAKQPNREQKEMSRATIDHGADLVVGHHPHVTQPVEEYNEGYIVYSLGNFVFDQDFSEETMRGFMLETKIRDGEITDIEKIPYELNEYFQPRVVE